MTKRDYSVTIRVEAPGQIARSEYETIRAQNMIAAATKADSLAKRLKGRVVGINEKGAGI